MAEERTRREEEARQLEARQAREREEQLRRQEEERARREREEMERIQKQVAGGRLPPGKQVGTALAQDGARGSPDGKRKLLSVWLGVLVSPPCALVVLAFSVLGRPGTLRAAGKDGLCVRSRYRLPVFRKKKKLVFGKKQRGSGRNGRSISREKSRSAWRGRR